MAKSRHVPEGKTKVTCFIDKELKRKVDIYFASKGWGISEGLQECIKLQMAGVQVEVKEVSDV